MVFLSKIYNRLTMSEKENIKKELHPIAPNLDKLKGENPFIAPEGYFDGLSGQISEKISISGLNKKENAQPVFQKLPRFVLVGVLSVMLMLAGYFFLLRDASQSINGIADEGFYEEYMVWYADYQTDAYYEMILETNNLDSETDSPDSDEQIVDYLMDYGYYYMESPADIID